MNQTTNGRSTNVFSVLMEKHLHRVRPPFAISDCEMKSNSNWKIKITIYNIVRSAPRISCVCVYFYYFVCEVVWVDPNGLFRPIRPNHPLTELVEVTGGPNKFKCGGRWGRSIVQRPTRGGAAPGALTTEKPMQSERRPSVKPRLSMTGELTSRCGAEMRPPRLSQHQHLLHPSKADEIEVLESGGIGDEPHEKVCIYRCNLQLEH